MLRVRFAPSPTGYLHIGSARTFIFNWLFARRHNGTMILRIDDTDLERNTEQSLQSIFDGLNWLDLGWDEQYRQSERLDLHRRVAQEILANGFAYRDFVPAGTEEGDKSHTGGPWLFSPGQREISREESDSRAAAGEPFVIRYRVPRGTGEVIRFNDLVYGEQAKSCDDIEDFALLRSNGMPTYHLASCADDADLKISHIVRGQDHLSNTFKHVLILRAAGAEIPLFAHLPLLVAPDGAKLSKRKHGPVVSVTTYRDAGFLAHTYVNFLCLLGWSPKDNREQMTREELIQAFSFEGVNRSNAVVNFTEENPIDPKALWLNAQTMRSTALSDLVPLVRKELDVAGLPVPFPGDWLEKTVDLLRARFSTLHDFAIRGRAYFSDEFSTEPDALKNLDKPGAREGLRALAQKLADDSTYTEESVETHLRAQAAAMDLKAGILINGARAALTGQSVGPSAFHVFTAIGKDRAIARLRAV